MLARFLIIMLKLKPKYCTVLKSVTEYHDASFIHQILVFFELPQYLGPLPLQLYVSSYSLMLKAR